ncbi:MAG: ATP-binding protein [Planctomycetota bacterium]
MTDGPTQKRFAETLARLQKDPEVIAWPERRALAKAVCESLASAGPSETALGLMFQLADDTKWEVRKDVADCLLLVPDDDFNRLTAKLSGDSNSFVRKAAERALDRRRRGERTAERRRRGLDQVSDLQSAIEKKYGPEAAEKAGQMAERLYDVMVGATAHDMKNILTPLKSSTESLLALLAEDRVDPKTFRKELTRVADRLAIMERLMEDMRTYSQTTPPERRRERLLDMVRVAHTMAQDIFRTSGRDTSSVAVEIDVPERLTVEVSRHQIVVAVANVLKNAYESFATGPDIFQAGRVTVSAKAINEDRVEILIRDEGMGLNREELEEVRRFVPGGTSKKVHGTGFGLPIARRKVIDHGGTLHIESELDRGTTVTITLPVEAEVRGES